MSHEPEFEEENEDSEYVAEIRPLDEDMRQVILYAIQFYEIIKFNFPDTKMPAKLRL